MLINIDTNKSIVYDFDNILFVDDTEIQPYNCIAIGKMMLTPLISNRIDLNNYIVTTVVASMSIYGHYT